MEFTADIRFIRRESRTGARTVLRAVNAALQRLRFFPERGRVDAEAQGVPPDASARKLSAKGHVIRYLYPVRDARNRRVVLIVSLRDGAQLPIGDEEFLHRFADEQARLHRSG